MVSYLTTIFGLGRLDLAEDVVQDTLCRALEIWPNHGVPDNPSAWLMRAARNRAIDLVRRDARLRGYTPELVHLASLREDMPVETPDFEKAIQDDTLRMMFSCCHPDLSTEVQVTLILKTLCGFSVAEIAHALLAREDAIEKRLGRARKLFRSSGAFVEITNGAEIPARLDAVYQAIYLLFNEGYHGSQSDRTVRDDLCFEAIRLALLLSEHPKAANPTTHALLALLCLHAARLHGRVGDDGRLIQLELQDRSTWDQELLERGFHYFEKACGGHDLSEYHLQAAIAAMHSAATAYDEIPWDKIVALYDMLYTMKPTPIVALNRAVAIGNARGPDQGLRELANLPDPGALEDYPFYPAAQGEFHLRAGHPNEAAKHFEHARKLARTQPEKDFFDRKLNACRLT